MEELQKELDELLRVLRVEIERPDANAMVAMALSSLTHLRDEMAAGHISSKLLDEYAYGLGRSLMEDLPWTEYGLGSDLIDLANKMYRIADKLK